MKMTMEMQVNGQTEDVTVTAKDSDGFEIFIRRFDLDELDRNDEELAKLGQSLVDYFYYANDPNGVNVCPGCGAESGRDELNPDCEHSAGCGFWRETAEGVLSK